MSIMIPIVRTQYLVEEMKTDGHNPMLFVCDDGNSYYCKYRNQYSKTELDCLVYELVCHYLLKRLNIPTPEIAFAVIEKDSYDINKLRANRRYITPETICFASKEATNTALVTGIQSITGKTQIRKFENIYDLLKIAIFDLWVDNQDRGNGSKENYNFLLQSIQVHNELTNKITTKYRWLAFDHAFAFGGVNNLRIFNETLLPSTSFKLVESQYFKTFKKYFKSLNYQMIIENCITLQRNEIERIIHDVFVQIPKEWQTPISLEERIVDFLSNEARINLAKQLVLNSLNK